MNKSLTNTSWAKILIIIILVLGIFFRFVNLDKKVYWGDETITSLRVSGYTQYQMYKNLFNGKEFSQENLQYYQHFNPNTNVIDTVYSLAAEDAHHPILYYVLTRFWVQIFGDGIAIIRSLAAVFSLLVFPAMYWLCLEFFSSHLVAIISILLIAVSPFHILYAQEAREYSLWTLFILLANASLLKAIKQDTKLNWLIYAIILVLGFNTAGLFGLIVLAHGIYMLIIKYQKLSELKLYLFASFAGFLSFVPWLLIMVIRHKTIASSAGWLAEKIPSFLYLVKSWILQFSSLFFDPNSQIFYNLNNQKDDLMTYLVRLPFVIIQIYAVYFVYKHTTKSAGTFLLLLIAMTGLTLMLSSAIFGAKLSVVSRYLIPCYLAMQISVAYLLSIKISEISPNIWRQKIWQILLLIIMSLGIFSGVISSQSNFWWNKSVGSYNIELAKTINASSHPLLITNPLHGSNLSDLLSLSYLLDAKTKFQVSDNANKIQIKTDYSDIFIYKPDAKFLTKLTQGTNYKAKPILQFSKNYQLWKMEK